MLGILAQLSSRCCTQSYMRGGLPNRFRSIRVRFRRTCKESLRALHRVFPGNTHSAGGVTSEGSSDARGRLQVKWISLRDSAPMTGLTAGSLTIPRRSRSHLCVR